MALRLADYLKWGPRDESKQDRGLSSARPFSRLSTETISCMSRSSSAFFVLVDTEATRRTIIPPNNQHQKPRHTVKTLPLNIGRPPSVTVLSPNTVELVITYRNRRPGKTCIKTARGTPSCHHEEKTFATSLVSAVWNDASRAQWKTSPRAGWVDFLASGCYSACSSFPGPFIRLRD